MIFVDTGPLIAHALSGDRYHAAAVRGMRRLERVSDPLVTSSFVLDETFTLLARRSSYPFAAERARVLLSSKALKVLRPGPEDEWEALERFEKLADQSVSFTDCISFALMRRERIDRVFTFDRHFRHAGFTIWPET